MRYEDVHGRDRGADEGEDGDRASGVDGVAMGMRVDYVCKLCGETVRGEFCHDAVVAMDRRMGKYGQDNETIAFSLCAVCGGVNDLTLTRLRTEEYLAEVKRNGR